MGIFDSIGHALGSIRDSGESLIKDVANPVINVAERAVQYGEHILDTFGNDAALAAVIASYLFGGGVLAGDAIAGAGAAEAGAAGAVAEGAGAAGALTGESAVGTGALAGEGAAGIDASTGAFAGETASSGAAGAGAGAGGAIGGSEILAPNAIPNAGDLGAAQGFDGASAGAPAQSPLGTPEFGDPSPPVQPAMATNAQMEQAISGSGSGSGVLGNLGNFLQNNVRTLLPLGLTAASTLGQKQGSPNEAQLKAIAEQQRAAGAQSQRLMQPLATDTLPESQQAGLDSSKDSIKAQIRAKYAKMGLAGSTMEQQELQGVDQQSLVVKGQIEKQLFDSGIGAAELSNNSASIYQQLASTTLSQDQQLRAAIQRLAGSFALGSSLGGSAGIAGSGNTG